MNSGLPVLNFPDYNFRVTRVDGALVIFDRVRKRSVKLSPEEWVRQHVICFLAEKGCPLSLMAVEKKVQVGLLTQRADIVVYDKNLSPWLVVECKAPNVGINEEVLFQAARYNMKLNARFFMLSNGLQHYFLERTQTELKVLGHLPDFPQEAPANR